MNSNRTGSTRSKNMTAIKSRDTQPEIIIRKALHGVGYRYRLHMKTIAGTPDLVFTKLGAVLFVNGCFWHKHDCHLFQWPRSRKEFWKNKLLRNASNDANNKILLEKSWRIGIVWECALKGKLRIPIETIVGLLCNWLDNRGKYIEIRGTNREDFYKYSP